MGQKKKLELEPCTVSGPPCRREPQAETPRSGGGKTPLFTCQVPSTRRHANGQWSMLAGEPNKATVLGIRHQSKLKPTAIQKGGKINVPFTDSDFMILSFRCQAGKECNT